MGGISIWQIAVIVIIALIFFGGRGKRLRNLGGDLGKSLKDFKTAMNDDSKPSQDDEDTSNIEHKDQAETTAESKVKEDEKV